jgi:hypothetical protein
MLSEDYEGKQKTDYDEPHSFFHASPFLTPRKILVWDVR